MADLNYFSIEFEAGAELTVKGSRFIAHAAPASDIGGAETFIAETSRTFHDATHNCFAYKIGVGDAALFRFSDAGEPSGTAGRPILQAIEAKKLTNVALVVTRYFGGTKLGTGGLVRAYHAAALAAMNHATLVPYFSQIRLRLSFPFQFTNTVHLFLNKFQGQVVESHFAERTEYVIQLRSMDAGAFGKELRDASSGRVGIEILA